MSDNRHANNFDGIRLIAAIMVLITHSYAMLGLGEHDLLSKLTLGALQFSHLGVAIFFIISGYLITQSAFNTKSYQGYLWRRALRIFPGLAVVLLICTFVLGPIVTNLSGIDYFNDVSAYKHLLSISLYRLYLNLPGVFTANPIKSVNGSLWTLAYEFSMYIAVISAYVAGVFRYRYLVAALWLLMFALRIYIGNNYFVYNYASPFLLGLNLTYFFEWAFFFLAGTVIYLFRDKFKFSGYVFLALLTMYVIAVLLANELLVRCLNYIIIPYAIFYLSFIPGWFNKIGSKGDFSYGMYIYAFPVQQLIVHYFGTGLSVGAMFSLSLIFTFPLAVFSWHLVEKRFLQLKNMVN